MLIFLRKTGFIWILSTTLFGGMAPEVAAANIVVSIKPIHSLVATITKGVTNPFLLLKGRASPHAYSLRPSDAKKLRNAKLIFWIGDDLETFLIKPLQTLGKRATIVALSKAKGLTRLKYRDKKHFKFKRKSGHDHGHEGVDQHFWLDPANAIAFSHKIETALQVVDPQNAKIYSTNSAQLRKRLITLIKKTTSRFQSLKQRPFFVFHEAYQYFENRFGLSAAGSVITHTDVPSSAKHISQILKQVKATGSNCVFTEPQFNPKLAKLVTRGTGARLSTIDPLGVNLKDGPGLYIKLIENVSKSFEDCLSITQKN